MDNEKRLNCPMRKENGNCLPAGGFCTAVNDSICEALHNAFAHGENEERDRLVLSMVEANAKYQEQQLEILRNIQEKALSDVAPVVRCRECKHRHTRPTCHGRRPDWFCADGERKGND